MGVRQNSAFQFPIGTKGAVGLLSDAVGLLSDALQLYGTFVVPPNDKKGDIPNEIIIFAPNLVMNLIIIKVYKK
jgi:hypothetical protein